MPFRSIDQGVKAIQAGNLSEGARLLRIALKDPAVTGEVRAVALLWLAETSAEREFKVSCYNEALAADPSNENVRQRLAYLLATQLPPEPTPPSAAPYVANPQSPAGYVQPNITPPAMNPVVTGHTPPYGMTPPANITPVPGMVTSPQTPMFFRTVGIIDGPNGPGTAFFVQQNGLLATTRYVVGGMENITIALDTGRGIPGRVVRSFPDLDIALIQVDIAVSSLLPITPLPTLPEDARLTAVANNGKVMSGQKRATKSGVPAPWFPTTINKAADAGGNPIFDERNYLVGMLTRNASRSSGYLYALHISALYKCVETYTQENSLDSSRTYCRSCGFSSRAVSFGGFYCEMCGSTLSYAMELTRFPVNQAAAFYGETMHAPCRHCGARAGYYNGACLRCGGLLNPPTKR